MSVITQIKAFKFTENKSSEVNAKRSSRFKYLYPALVEFTEHTDLSCNRCENKCPQLERYLTQLTGDILENNDEHWNNCGQVGISSIDRKGLQIIRKVSDEELSTGWKRLEDMWQLQTFYQIPGIVITRQKPVYFNKTNRDFRWTDYEVHPWSTDALSEKDTRRPV